MFDSTADIASGLASDAMVLQFLAAACRFEVRIHLERDSRGSLARPALQYQHLFSEMSGQNSAVFFLRGYGETDNLDVVIDLLLNVGRLESNMPEPSHWYQCDLPRSREATLQDFSVTRRVLTTCDKRQKSRRMNSGGRRFHVWPFIGRRPSWARARPLRK